MRRRTVRRAAHRGGVAAVLAVALVACTTAVPGVAAPAPGSAPATSVAPTGPPADIIPAPALSVGTVLEAHRIAGVTALVQTTFPERTEFCFPYGPQVATGRLDALYFGDRLTAPILDRFGFVAAWGQCHRDGAGLATLTLVMELSDPAAAARAAEELITARDDDAQEPVQLSASGVRALLGVKPGRDTVQSWAPVGRMLAYSYHDAVTGQGVAGADRLMADQTALLATFSPTPQADVPALPIDPLGLQQFALAFPGDTDPISGPYDLAGYLRLAIDPAREREVLSANGFTGMYYKSATVDKLTFSVALYAFPTSAQTNAVYTAFADLETTAFSGTPFRVPSIPGAPCFSVASSSAAGTEYFQRCYVGYGSYLAGLDVSGVTKADDYSEMNRLLPLQRDLIDG